MSITLWKPEPNLITHQALGKLLEELGELSSIVARCLIQGITESEPVTGATNYSQLQKEMSDVAAAIDWLKEVSGVSIDTDRMYSKLDGYRRWQKMLEADMATASLPTKADDTDTRGSASPYPRLVADDWFSQVVSFLVKNDMLDARDEYDISDVMGALEDNYEPMLVKAVQGIADDYMTSEKHHPGYVLIPTSKFEAICAAIAATSTEGRA
jgi:hypothetical protein